MASESTICAKSVLEHGVRRAFPASFIEHLVRLLLLMGRLHKRMSVCMTMIYKPTCHRSVGSDKILWHHGRSKSPRFLVVSRVIVGNVDRTSGKFDAEFYQFYLQIRQCIIDLTAMVM